MTDSLRLILWPTVITLVINVLRLVLQVQGVVGTQTGGGLAPLGITWLVFVFGAWFGWRLGVAGSRPALPWSILWGILLLAALIVAVRVGFGAVDRADRSEAAYAALRDAIGTITWIALGAAALSFAVWPRLALTMLLYAIPARLTVLALTYLAKAQGWDTHYTKFGPAGIERDGVGETMYAASIAQLGFWVPFTVVGGLLAGTVAVRLARARRE